MAGRIKYVTNELLREIENIKLTSGVHSDSDAQRILVKHSLVGREMEKINFLHPPKRRRY